MFKLNNTWVLYAWKPRSAVHNVVAVPQSEKIQPICYFIVDIRSDLGYKGIAILKYLNRTLRERTSMPNLLRISDAASLALHTMVFITNRTDQWVSTHEIAETLGVSENHLAKVRERLVKVGLVEAVRGPKGGFKLGRPADEITLLDIYEAIEGPMHPAACLLGKPACGRHACILGGLIDSVNRQVVDYFTNTTLTQLVEATAAK